jgi:glycosyltransferase involved in cell wall biosynthesis
MAGISFMVRVRNEEATLYESINSLKGLTIPHEIIIILHLCTDRSAEIAEQLRQENTHVKLYSYGTKISRAGYETLATPAHSSHSLPTYYNWCLEKTRNPWLFKWDGDFIASPGLILYLNDRTWAKANARIRINAVNSTSKNGEFYLTSGLYGYVKNLFWEVPTYPEEQEIREISDDTVVIHHKSELSELKSYWLDQPWYETEESEEARLVSERMRRLRAEIGDAPKGMARASNAECDPIFRKLMRSEHRNEYCSW